MEQLRTQPLPHFNFRNGLQVACIGEQAGCVSVHCDVCLCVQFHNTAPLTERAEAHTLKQTHTATPHMSQHTPQLYTPIQCTGSNSCTGLPTESSVGELTLLRHRCADAEERLEAAEQRCVDVVRQLENAKQRGLETQKYADEARRCVVCCLGGWVLQKESCVCELRVQQSLINDHAHAISCS